MDRTILSKVLQECYSQECLEQGFYSTRLTSRLFSSHCITLEEKQDVEACNTQTSRSRALMDILMRKSDSILKVILRHFGEDRTQSHLEKVISDSALKFGYDDSPITTEDTRGSPQPKRSRVQALPQKWWPEQKEMITSFVERKSDDGELFVSHLRSHLLSTKCKTTAIVSKKHAIVGMGGIGKTSTAKWYTNKYVSNYDHIIWIDSEGQSLTNSFVRLGKRISLQRDDFDSFEEFVREIYDTFYELCCLFVFDNAERFDGENGLKNILPRNELHHSIITSRNHDWGHASEFGQIPTFQLDVFTESECVALFTTALERNAVGKFPTEREILDLGAELGFLPLALQCAVATINKSKRYTVATYLTRIRADMVILVEKKILSEYERSISATLHLSIEQIERDEDIDNECREWCKIILNVAAYCEPSDIPESLFIGLPNIDKLVLGDSVDQLLQYSLISAELERQVTVTEEQKYEDERRFGIHRLLQHVIRHKVLVDSERAIRAIRLAFKCMERHLEVYYLHAIRAWNLASGQFDEIMVTCHTFPYDVSRMHSVMQDFIETSITNLKRVYKESDLPIIQLRLRLIQVLLDANQSDKAQEVHKRLCQLTIDEPVTREKFNLHLRIVALDIEEQRQKKSPDALQTSDILLQQFASVLKELTDTGYNGEISDTKMYYEMQTARPGLNLALAVTLSYVHCLCDAEKEDTAIEVLTNELSRQSSSKSLDIANVCNVFITLDDHDQVMQGAIPVIYTAMKDNLLVHGPPKADGYKFMDLGHVARQIAIEYAKWLNREARPVSESMAVLSLFEEYLQNEDTMMVGDLVLQIAEDTSALSQPEMERLNAYLGSAWCKVLELINQDQQEHEEDRPDQLVRLFKLNWMHSQLLCKCGKLAEIRKLDSQLNSLLERPVDWNTVMSNMYATSVCIAAGIADLRFVNDAEATQTLESKLTLLSKFLSLIGAVPVPEMKHNCFTMLALMDVYDAVCLILVRMQQPDRAILTWEESMSCLGAPSARDWDHVSLEVVSRVGKFTFKCLEDPHQVGGQTAQALTTLMAPCIEICLQRYKLMGEMDSYELSDITALILRLAACKQYSAAKRVLELVAKAVKAEEDDSDELVTALKDSAMNHCLDQETTDFIEEMVAMICNEVADETKDQNPSEIKSDSEMSE